MPFLSWLFSLFSGDSDEEQEMASIIGIKGLEAWTPAERKGVLAMATRLGTNADYLASAMKFESNLNEKAINSMSGASGLIQFMPETAKNLGAGKTDAEAIANIRKMNKLQQLVYVEKYFAPHKGNLKTLKDVYATIFYPVAVGKPDDWVVAHEGTKVYEENSVFDKPYKGYITAKDISKPVQSIYDAAISNPRIAVALGMWTVMFLGAAATAAYYYLTDK